MKKQSNPRIHLALRTETVRTLAASQLTDIVGGLNTLQICHPRDTVMCPSRIC